MDFQENYQRNLEALETSKPRIAEFLSGWEDRFDLILSPADGGGFFLALSTEDGQRALSEPTQPVFKAEQLAQKEIPGAPHYDPLLLSGVRAGYELLAFFQKMHKEPGGRWQALYLIEPSPDLFKAMMHLHDLRLLFVSEHFFCFVGPDALKDVEDFFLGDPMKPLPKKATMLGSPGDAQAAVQTISAILKILARSALAKKKAIDEYYNSLKPLDWIDWLHRGEDLRILQISSGFSHFVRYANRDIGQALESLGHQTRIISELDRVDHLTGPALLEVIDEFKPHLIHHIDHMRFESAQIYPEKVLFLTSMLDYFPALESEASSAKMGDWDFVTGYVSHWEKFGYRYDRLLPQEPMSNENIFRPIKLDQKQTAKYNCEASYISNISKTPEEYFTELLRQYNAEDRAIAEVAEAMFNQVQSEYVNGNILYEKKDYQQIFETVGGHKRVPKSMGEVVVDGFFALVGNAFFRQLPLIALSEAGVDLRLYGRGWERHPRLSKHACGVVEHGEDSNLVFNASAINLHINQFRMRHNRLNDGYAAGAFFLIHKHLDELPFNVEGILFSGKERLIEMVRDFLGSPEKRRDNAAINRQIVLDNFTYRVQYDKTLRRLGFFFGASFFDEAIAKLDMDFTTFEQGPVCERLGKQSLSDLLKLTKGFDLDQAMNDFFKPDDETGDEQQARNIMLSRSITEKMAEADLSQAKHFITIGEKITAAGYLSSALFIKPDDQKIHKRFDKLIAGDAELARLAVHRKLIKEKTFALPQMKLPFGLTLAPDKRIAISDWAGIKNVDERSVFLVDPKNGSVEEFAGGPGLQRGDFGSDGAYYTQLLGLNGVYRVTPKSREKIIETGSDTNYGIILQTLVCEDGGLLIHDWSAQGIFLHDAGGRFVREVISPGVFDKMYGLNLRGNHLYFLSGDQIHHKLIDSNEVPDIYPKAPGGIYDYLTVGSEGMYATIGQFQMDKKKKQRIMKLAGMAALDMEGSLRFLSYKNPFTLHPVILMCFESESKRHLSALDCNKKQLLIFQV